MTCFKTFYYELLIKEHHLDTFGHVNNAKYLELLEEARWDFLNTQGFDLAAIHKTQVGPVVLECHIQFLRELRLRQMIRIESQMIAFEKKIGVMRQDIFNDEGEQCSHAKLTFGFLNMRKRKLILPSEAWLLAIGIEH